MMKIIKTLDTRRFAQAIRGPNIDPRTHVSIGVIAHDYDYLKSQFVADKNDVKIDKYAIYANVILTPELTPVFCKIAPAYAGAFGGLYFPYHSLDTVIVVIPDGNMNNHPTIISHFYTGTERVPTQIDLNNMWLVLEDGANLNIMTLGGTVTLDINGAVNIKSHNNDITLASDASGIAKVGRVGDTTLSNATYDAAFWAWIDAVQAVCSALNIAVGKAIPPIIMPIVPTSETGQISSGSSIVKAGG